VPSFSSVSPSERLSWHEADHSQAHLDSAATLNLGDTVEYRVTAFVAVIYTLRRGQSLPGSCTAFDAVNNVIIQ
jgi:hypothetical protein